ncbi:MAG: S8 family serine peptidase [Chloroflexi bacterium]|nr:S8 family serine peptidase [Chloroflexota bacterium]
MDNIHPKPQPMNHQQSKRLYFLLPIILLLLGSVAPLLHAQAPEDSYVLDSTLRMFRALRAAENAPPRIRALLQSDKVGVSIRFRPSLRQPSLAQMEKQLGIEFARVNGKTARVGNIYGARVSWEALEQLARWPGVERIDSTWKPVVAAPLDVSIPEIRANLVWNLLDAGGWPLTGRGVVIADFDTGVDVFHPDLWRADGGTYPWLDVDGNGRFDPGIDAVDLNRNGSAEPTERLNFIDSSSSPADGIPGTNDGAFHAATDWLYNDANGNSKRDFGPTSGFAEAHPTYGERLFLLNDSNQNGTVDIGEVLLALGTCKVQRVLGPNASEYIRGVNLISAPPDSDGHGTQVCSILAGGNPGLRRYVGVAPDARLLVAQCLHNENTYTTYIPWAEENGAQIMLYEFGSWIQEFMDGTSNLERMLDAEAAKGIIQVAPAGNLAESNKHASLLLGGGAPNNVANVRFAVPPGWGLKEAYLSVLWRAPLDALSVQLITPSGATVSLPGNDSVVIADGHYVVSSRDRSPATSRFDIWIHRGGADITPGNWTLRLRNQTTSWVNVHAYVGDDVSSWEGGIIFLDNVDAMCTVTSPATANSAITVASYSTRAREGTTPPGSLSPFSSQGPRIDGEWVMDLAAPGHYDIACARSKDISGATFGQYAWFGGTSAAAAHVAGAVALLLQRNPFLSPAQMMQLLQSTARQDAYTGVRNERWGYGKLDAWAALAAIPTPTPIPTPTLTPTITPTPRVRFFLPLIMKGVMSEK